MVNGPFTYDGAISINEKSPDPRYFRKNHGANVRFVLGDGNKIRLKITNFDTLDTSGGFTTLRVEARGSFYMAVANKYVLSNSIANIGIDLVANPPDADGCVDLPFDNVVAGTVVMSGVFMLVNQANDWGFPYFAVDTLTAK